MSELTEQPPDGDGADADATTSGQAGEGGEGGERGQARERALRRGAQALARLLADVRVAWSVALLAVLVAAVLASWWAPLHTQARDRERVQTVGTELVLHLTTFEGATIDEWVRETQARATGAYAEQVAALFDAELRSALRSVEALSRGQLLDLFVQRVEGDEALVFAVVRQTVTNDALDEPVEDELRLQVRLRRAQGRWRAADVEVLGPSEGPLRADLNADLGEASR